MSHIYGIFSWWWAHSCRKHVEKSNKHITKICAPGCHCLQKIIQGCTVNKTLKKIYIYIAACINRYAVGLAMAASCTDCGMYNNSTGATWILQHAPWFVLRKFNFTVTNKRSGKQSKKKHHVCILYTLRVIPLKLECIDVTRCLYVLLTVHFSNFHFHGSVHHVSVNENTNLMQQS